MWPAEEDALADRTGGTTAYQGPEHNEFPEKLHALKGDMWAAGCMAAELMLGGYQLFPVDPMNEILSFKKHLEVQTLIDVRAQPQLSRGNG